MLGRIAQAAAAAGISWELALQLHPAPFFAPIAAVISLGAAIGRRGRQAVEMVTGVALGILLGAAITAVAGVGAFQLVLATLIAFVLATAAGASPLVRNQAAASAILVVALHRPGQNLAIQRLEDALIGGAVAIALARFLFPVNPVEIVREEARSIRARLAEGLDETAAALAGRDAERAGAALHRIDAIDEHRLGEALMLAREVARAAPRRRPLRRQIEALGELYRELEASVGDAHAIATGASRLLAGDEAPAGAVEAIRDAAAAIRAVEPAEARAAAGQALASARRLRERDGSLGAGVIAHGVAAIAGHVERGADAREHARSLE